MVKKLNNPLKLVSFDWDGCLGHLNLMRYVAQSLSQQVPVIVVTRRPQKVGLEPEWSHINKDFNLDFINKVYFTEGELKADTLVKLGVSIHFDDDVLEVTNANDHFGFLGQAVLVDTTWQKMQLMELFM